MSATVGENVPDYEDWGIHDNIMCLVLREIFTYEQIKGIIRSQSVKLVRTKQGCLLRLRGREGDKLEVDYDLEGSKQPRLFVLSLKLFEDYRSRYDFDERGELLPDVVDVSD